MKSKDDIELEDFEKLVDACNTEEELDELLELVLYTQNKYNL